MRVFISAGEASGDAYAAAIAVEMLSLTGAQRAGASIEGIGGPKLARVSTGPILDSSRWGAISIVQSIRVSPRVIAGYNRAKRLLSAGEPGLLIAIDFGYFNIRLARMAKRLGWEVLYFMPPASWRRDKQGKDLPFIADAVVTPFPWSAELLQQRRSEALAQQQMPEPETLEGNAWVHFYGHPLKQLIRDWRQNATPVQAETVAVLPGSRNHEVDRNLHLIAGVARSREFAATPFEFAIAANLNAPEIERTWKKLAPNRTDAFTQGDVYGVLSRGRAAIVCSGTATLEAALLNCPMVVIYQVTKAMAREAKLIRFQIPEFISLPNIILQRRLVPEFVGLNIDQAAVARDLLPLLSRTDQRRQQLEGFREIDALLGPSDAITRTAQLALGMLIG